MLHMIRNVCLNALMYADDLVLLTISVTDLQMLINLCVEEFAKLKMKTNIKNLKKTFYLILILKKIIKNQSLLLVDKTKDGMAIVAM